MKIKLRRVEYPYHVIHWKKALPFFFNRRGVLIHRVRHAITHTDQSTGKPRHSSVGYWCGNTGNLSKGELLSEPPESRLLCTLCETKATAAGEVSADILVGHHVHLGRMKPIKTCCQDSIN